MRPPFNNIYQGKRVLVTGHTGFKGSWLSLWLMKLGADVVGYSLDIPTQPSHFELLKLEFPSIIENILNREKLREAFARYKPDIVFHVAAQPIVRRSYRDPAFTMETNIMGTINVLECCRTTDSARAAVIVTSDKCYQNRELKRGYHEDDPMGGNDPYSASKGAAEIVSNSYRHSFFNNNAYGKTHQTLVADVRAGNVIGGGDWAVDRLIPDLVRAAADKKPGAIRYPNATRPWQHVLEPLSGYLHLGWKLLEGKTEFAENWNFGPLDEANQTVRSVIEKSKAIWPDINYEIREDPSNFHEASLLMLDSSKARTQLLWQSVWEHATTLEKTINWYREYYRHGRVTSENDLNAYLHDAEQAHVQWILS